MADDQNLGAQKKEEASQEVSATDLLSLWGGGVGLEDQKSKVKNQNLVAPEPAASRPIIPVPEAVPKMPFAAPPAPKPAPVAPVAPKPVLQPLLKPKLSPLEPAIEGEIISPEDLKPKKKPEEKPAAIQAGAAPKPSPLPAETVTPEESLLPEKEESFASQFDEFLAELNLSRKHIFMGLGCFVLVIILIIGGFFTFRYFKNWKTEPEMPLQPSGVEEPADAAEEPPAPVDEIKLDNTGISATEKIGTDIQIDKKLIGETGISAVVSIGTEFESATPLSDYIYNFRRLQNAYETNVDEILDKSTNRRARLQAHLAVLRWLNTESTKKLQQIAQEIASIKAAYEPLRSEQEVLDKNFFEQLDALNGQTADDILNEFTGVTREIVTLRARFQALQKLQSFYEQALPKVARLIRDIELNEEALVSGLKIYDVRGSDLKLIVPVSDETLPKEQLESSSLPLIPIHPSQVQTGRDYITQPGGGF